MRAEEERGRSRRAGRGSRASAPDARKEVQNEAGKEKKRGRQRQQMKGEGSYYNEWWTKEQVDEGIAAGQVVVGVLRINAHKRTEAYVTSERFRFDIFIDGEKARNRALNNDLVAVHLLPKEKWRHSSKSEVVNELAAAMKNMELEEDDAALWNPLVSSNSNAAKPTEKESEIEVEARKDTKSPESSLQPVGEVVALLVSSEESGLSIAREEMRTQIGVIVPQYGFSRTEPSRVVPGKHLPAGDRFIEFHPLDNRIPFMLIPRENAPQDFLEDPYKFAPPHAKLFEAALLRWEPAFRFPLARLVRQVGEAGEIGPETDALLMETNCDHGEFPPDALEVLKQKIPESGLWEIPAEEFGSRRDLRTSRRIFTVDPATAKDLDDALHCLPVAANSVKGVNGAFLPAHFEIGVHIADVSFFVEPGNALDKEAQRRSTTVYLVNRVIPMLPPILSEEFCSLNEGVDRCAFSCIWRMSEEGELLPNAPPPWFGRTVIRSCARLDYGLAQRMVDGQVTAESVDTGNEDDDNCWPSKREPAHPHTKQEVIDDVRNLVSIAMKRRKKRFSRQHGGALAMKQVKMSFKLDSTGNPASVREYPIRDTNKTIEEYMLMANYLVAQQLILGAEKKGFIRHHPPPDPKSMTAFVRLLEIKNIPFDRSSIGSAAGLHSFLETVEQTQTPLLVEVIYALLRKPMMPAKYSPAGSLTQREWRHWALNIPYYTHFTSPIRRYADIVVHRQLQAVLDRDMRNYSDSLDDLQKIAEHCNEKKEQSKKAQEQSDKLFFSILVKQRFESGQPLETKAVVHDLGPRSFKIFLVEYGVDSTVHAENDFHGTNVKVEFEKTPGMESLIANNNDREEGNRSRGRNRGSRGGRGSRRSENSQSGRQDRKHNGKNDKQDANVQSLTMNVAPFSLPGLPQSPSQSLKLELLTCMDVVLIPTVTHNARIDIKPQFLRVHEGMLEQLESNHT